MTSVQGMFAQSVFTFAQSVDIQRDIFHFDFDLNSKTKLRAARRKADVSQSAMFGIWKYDHETDEVQNLRQAWDPVTARSSQHQACNRCHEKKVILPGPTS